MINKLAVDIGSKFIPGGGFLTTTQGIGRLFEKLANNFLMVIGIAFVFIIIYGGTQMISSAGDPQSYARAQKILTSGIVGLIISASAWVIVRIAEVLTGANIL